MPRNNRIYGNSKIYHVMLRGINKKDIFFDDSDRNKFIKSLKDSKEKYHYKLYAYCLMKNHIHLLIFDEWCCLSSIIQSIAIKYALYFNKKYNRCGHLFQNRYKNKCVENDIYFKNLIRYIHQNPEKAGICLTEDYNWSSFSDYVNVSYLTDCDFVLEQFDNSIENFRNYNLTNINRLEDEIEFEFISRVDDETAVKMIKTNLKVEDISKIINYNITIRNKYIHEIKKIKCLSYNQISRILKVNRKIVERA